MKRVILGLFMFLVLVPAGSRAELFTDPAVNVGKKNLVVGAEYSGIRNEYDLDTKDLPVQSQRALLKATTGLTDWFDIYIKGGGASLLLNYKEVDSSVTKNFDSKMEFGAGAGARLRLLNSVNSRTQLFIQGGGFFFKNSGTIEKSNNIVQTTTNRTIQWLDLNAGIGISKRVDYAEFNIGLGFSDIKWWLDDTVMQKTGSATSTGQSKRDSFEIKNPLFGFFGIDFILPLEYRISIQAGIRNSNSGEFTVAVSQGLEK
jgi:hypothetical protein